MLFSEVAFHFAQIELQSSRLEMTRTLADLLGKASPSEAGIIAHLSLGELHAPHIGTKFNMAEKNVALALADFLKLTSKEIEHRAKELGDMGLIISPNAWKTENHKTVHQVYDALCAIEQISGSGSVDEKVQVLSALLSELDPVSARFVVRIILGRLRLGFSDMTIIDALSWMEVKDKSLKTSIEDAYNVCADIGLIAQTLKKEGRQGIETMHIQLGIPIRPAAAERLPTAKDIVEKLGDCIAQPKLDGFRLQIHLDKRGKEPIVHFFSRNLQDMSAMFPDLAKAVIRLDVKTLICEGEAIVFDPQTGSFAKFQETVKRKRKHGIEQAIEDFPLQVFIFDGLYLNGQSLLDKSTEQRRAAIEPIIHAANSDLIQLIGEQKIDATQTLEDYFNAAISAGLEGVVVKRKGSHYQPGKRNFNWIKLKRQEEGHLEDTLDCVILGYYAGQGKRAHFGVGAFLVGLYNKQQDRFETVAKIGTGLKDEDWKELKKKCDALKTSEHPKNVVCAKELVPDVWVYPEIVCSIRADEITLSPLHAAGKTATHSGYALRFPRFMEYRTDKSATEATTTHEIKRLYDDQFKK